MKKYIYFLVFISFLYAPIAGTAQTSIGVKGQINSMSAPLVIKRDLLSKALGETLNPGFGILIEHHINTYSSFQSEILYQEQSKSFILTGGDRVINTSILKYIRVPILIKYKFPFSNWNLIGMIGPNFGYALDLKSGETNKDFNLTSYEKLNFSEHNIKRFDMGISCGIGVEKTLANNMKTTLSVRYNLGLIDIMEDSQNTFYNRGYALDMGFMIPLQLFKKEKEKP